MLAGIGRGLHQRRDRRASCSSARARSRPTSTTCSPSSACATAPPPSSSPSTPTSSPPAAGRPAQPHLPLVRSHPIPARRSPVMPGTRRAPRASSLSPASPSRRAWSRSTASSCRCSRRCTGTTSRSRWPPTRPTGRPSAGTSPAACVALVLGPLNLWNGLRRPAPAGAPADRRRLRGRRRRGRDLRDRHGLPRLSRHHPRRPVPHHRRHGHPRSWSGWRRSTWPCARSPSGTTATCTASG